MKYSFVSPKKKPFIKVFSILGGESGRLRAKKCLRQIVLLSSIEADEFMSKFPFEIRNIDENLIYDVFDSLLKNFDCCIDYD